MAIHRHQQQRIRPVEEVKPFWLEGAAPAERQSSLRKIDVRIVQKAAYQRNLDPAKLRRMVRNWNPNDVGHITLSRRANGHYFVIDGQHRIEAILRMEGVVSPITDAIVWEGLTAQDEAEMFYRTQDPKARKALTPEDIHNAKLYAGEGSASAIQRIVQKAGFRIGPTYDGEQAGRIVAVGKLSDVYDQYGETVLQDTLDLIALTWGNAKGPEANLIAGTALFLAMFPEANIEPLIKRISKTPMDVWVGDAKRRAVTLGLTNTSGVASLLHDNFNKTRTRSRLEPFDERYHKFLEASRAAARKDAENARRQ